jgi:hypothetical protein
MSKRKYIIHLRIFSEHLFRLLTTLTKERKDLLSTEEKVMLATVEDIRKFCARETFEKQLFIYTKLGEEWTLNFGPEEAIQETLEACEYQFDHTLHRLDAVDAIVRDNVCCVSSRDVMLLSQMCAQNCKTEGYRLTYLMTKTKRTTNKLSKAYDIETQEAAESLDLMNKLMLEQLKARWFAQDNLNLGPQELLILLTLFENKNGAYSIKDILLILVAESNKKFVTQHIGKLEEKGFVMSDRKKIGIGRWSKNVYYSITTRGIQIVTDYHFSVLEKVLKD